MDELLTRLEQLPFWKNLSQEEKDRTLSLSVIREYEKGNILHATDGDCLGLAMVLSGSVRAYMMSEEGREITLYHIHDGEWDVLTASCIMYQITFDTQMVIEEKSRILIVPTTALARLKEENIYVRSFIYEALTERFSDVMWTIQQILFYGIDQRVAAYLVHRAEEQGYSLSDAGGTKGHAGGAGGTKSSAGDAGGDDPVIMVTHEEIAREINTAREVVARIVKHFINDGLVETGRGKVKIKDPRRIYELAGDLI